ncbi:MAG: hypothetical protein LUO87_01865 [Methanomicrobiales archaeon]|nr:hypothetical protein [Methanomicrobiales archaeon]MDD1659958.1 hypothetical protein [Methanomicrobiales archaeon]
MKREEEKKTPVWKKVAFIAIGVAFVGMMILSSWGMGWLTTFRTVQPLETVELQFTIRDGNGNAILTTDLPTARAALQQGIPVFYASEALPMTAGKTGSPAFTLIPAYNPVIGSTNFALFGQEYDEMSVGLLGLHAGESRTIPFAFNDTYEQTFTAEYLESRGFNFSTLAVGDLVSFGISTTPVVEGLENETQEEMAVRTASVVEKTNESATFRFRYATAQLSFAEFPR